MRAHPKQFLGNAENFDNSDEMFHIKPLLTDFSIKVFLYAITLCIGLHLRFVMREWTEMFRRLVSEPDNRESIEKVLGRSIMLARREAYFYWILIICFLLSPYLALRLFM